MSTKSAVKKKRTTAIERHTVIALSTAHVPESLATADDFAARSAYMDGLAAMTGAHGWLVSVNAEWAEELIARFQKESSDSIPGAITEILHWAKRRGASYVLFDSDGPRIERFGTYDW